MFLTILLAVVTAASSGMAADYYQIAWGDTQDITEFGVCTTVANNHDSELDLFVPTHSEEEWLAFSGASVTSININPCGGGSDMTVLYDFEQSAPDIWNFGDAALRDTSYATEGTYSWLFVPIDGGEEQLDMDADFYFPPETTTLSLDYTMRVSDPNTDFCAISLYVSGGAVYESASIPDMNNQPIRTGTLSISGLEDIGGQNGSVEIYIEGTPNICAVNIDNLRVDAVAASITLPYDFEDDPLAEWSPFYDTAAFTKTTDYATTGSYAWTLTSVMPDTEDAIVAQLDVPADVSAVSLDYRIENLGSSSCALFMGDILLGNNSYVINSGGVSSGALSLFGLTPGQPMFLGIDVSDDMGECAFWFDNLRAFDVSDLAVMYGFELTPNDIWGSVTGNLQRTTSGATEGDYAWTFAPTSSDGELSMQGLFLFPSGANSLLLDYTMTVNDPDFDSCSVNLIAGNGSVLGNASATMNSQPTRTGTVAISGLGALGGQMIYAVIGADGTDDNCTVTIDNMRADVPPEPVQPPDGDADIYGFGGTSLDGWTPYAGSPILFTRTTDNVTNGTYAWTAHFENTNGQLVYIRNVPIATGVTSISMDYVIENTTGMEACNVGLYDMNFFTSVSDQTFDSVSGTLTLTGVDLYEGGNMMLGLAVDAGGSGDTCDVWVDNLRTNLTGN